MGSVGEWVRFACIFSRPELQPEHPRCGRTGDHRDRGACEGDGGRKYKRSGLITTTTRPMRWSQIPPPPQQLHTAWHMCKGSRPELQPEHPDAAERETTDTVVPVKGMAAEKT